MQHYSDNLYSGNDSDDESFSEELSPTDGYFGPPQVPSNAPMVPDPSIDYGPAEAKTLISPPINSQASTGRASRLSHHAGLPQITPSQSYASPHPSHGHSSSPTQFTPSSPLSSRRRETSFSEHDQLAYNPPPAYSESPPQSEHSLPSNSPPPSLTSSRIFNRETYSTFPETHLERGFLPQREPESMGGPVDGPGEETPLLPRRKRYSPRRRRIKGLLFAALVFAVVGTTLSIVFGCNSSVSSIS